LQDTFREILEGYFGEKCVILGQTYNMECEESSFFETEHFWKKILKFSRFFGFSVSNHKDIKESEKNVTKTDNNDVLVR